jgi:hypothetical protein
MEASLAAMGRIPIDLRIGVTGHRWIPDDATSRHIVRAALEQIIAASSHPAMRATTIGVTVVSALAEGADRIVAHVGLDLGARLEVVLPLEAHDYERDFTSEASRDQFHDLCAGAASVHVVDATPSRNGGYDSAGRMMADRIDVLIAIHDGEPARGAGGTAEIVRYTQSLGIPVVDLRATRGASPVVAAPVGLPDLSTVPLAPDALRRLDAFNTAELSTDEQQAARAALERDPDQQLLPYYLRADELALRYQGHHRLAISMLYALSALAVATVAFQHVFFENVGWLGWIEFAALVVVFVISLLRVSVLGRWTSARFIAERLRSAMFLARVGGVPTFASVPGTRDEDRPGADWAGRAVREVWFRNATSNDVDLVAEARRIAADLVQAQIDYHQQRRGRWERLQRRTTWLAIVLFGVSVLSSLAHSLHPLPENWPDVTVFISIVIPAVAAAISGFAAQSEFGRQAMQSAHALRELQRLQVVLRSVQSEDEVRPLVARLDALMHGDTAEWYVSASLHDEKLPG